MSFLNENGLGITGFVIPWTYLAGSAAVAIALVLSNKSFKSRTHKNGVPFPPGPPPTWFWEDPMPKKQYARPVGYRAGVSSTVFPSIAHELTTLVEQYGPVVSLRRGGHVTVIIGRMDAATEIMEKEGGALVDRPHIISVGDILSGGMRLILVPAGNRFRRLRRAAHTHLQPKEANTYQEIQAETAKHVVLDILNDPKRHIEHAQRYASTVILRITYGKASPTSSNDPEVVRVNRVVKNFQNAMKPGEYLVDRIPWLRYVPGYGRQLKDFHQYELSLFRDQLNRVRDDMASSSAGPSFGRTLLERADDHQLSTDEMAYLAGILFSAGSDTTAVGITIMVMAAACHPNAQARVQEELDDVVGRDRVPTFGDWEMLPQLHAFMLEAMRWRPVVPLGFAHRATSDIIWKGHCIPAGATVIGCHWPISRDPEVFPDPEKFNPQRWLTEEGRLRTDMRFFTYGFGRRVCPGEHVANRSLYINLALLLWSFRILQRPEAPIDLSPSGFQDLVVFHPKPFEVDFVPRMKEEQLRELISQ